MKWFASAAVLMGVIVGLAPLAFSSRAPTWLWPVMFLIGVSSIPVTAGIAILRYRLYDIDRIISRTLSYTLVTAFLAGVFALVVLVPTALIGSGTGTPDWLVAAATLVVAALFRPVRRRMQDAVDHRFNRARYDAVQTIDAFAARLHEEIDLASLTAEITDVVHGRWRLHSSPSGSAKSRRNRAALCDDELADGLGVNSSAQERTPAASRLGAAQEPKSLGGPSAEKRETHVSALSFGIAATTSSVIA
jgi:hypothetical protein